MRCPPGTDSDRRSCKEAFYDKELILADRELVETGADELLRDADTEDVAFLVVGDPLGYAHLLPDPPLPKADEARAARRRTPTSSSAHARSASPRASSTTRQS